MSLGRIISWKRGEGTYLLFLPIDSPHGRKIISGRKSSNLSRTLKTMEHYGIVELSINKKNIVQKVTVTDFRVVFGLRNRGQAFG